MAGVAVTVALSASWDLALPLVAFAALTVCAMLSAWWLMPSIPKGRPGAKEATQSATLPQTHLWVAVSAAASGLSLAAGLIVVRPWWQLFSDADALARTVSVLVLIAALLAAFLPRAMVRSRME